MKGPKALFYTDDERLEEVRRVARLVSPMPVLTVSDFRKHSHIAPTTLTRIFGAWQTVLERAGLRQMYSGGSEAGLRRAQETRYTDEYLLGELRRVAGLLDRPVLTVSDFSKHSGIHLSTLRKRLGTWPTVLERAGLGHMCMERVQGSGSLVHRRIPDEDMLNDIRRVAQIVGKPVPTTGDYDKHGAFGSGTCRKRFKNWRTALERAGMEYATDLDRHRHTYGRIPDDVLLEEVRRVAQLINKPTLTLKDFAKHSSSGAKVLYRFGDWHTMLERAGLGHMFSGHFCRPCSDQDLIEEIRRVAAIMGKPPLEKRDFFRHCRISETTLRRRFGGWRAACERAGVGTRGKSRPTSEMILEEVRRVAQVVGKPVLTHDDFDKYSKFSVGTARRRFGEWRDVLEQAGLRHMWFGTASGRHSDEEKLRQR